jgi:hypothetical protein
MPKLKLNKPVRRLAKAARAPRSRNPGPPPNTSEHESVLTGLTDPFSPEAHDARYPDQGAGRTLTFTQKFATVISTDGNGNSAAAFNPKVNFPFIKSNSIGGTVVTWPATWDAGGSIGGNLVNAYGRSYRPTSMGVRVSNLLSATASSGYMVIAKGGIPPPVLGTTTISPQGFTGYDVHPMAHGGEWHAVSHPSSARGYTMKDCSEFNTNIQAGDDSWETVYLFVVGSAASTSVLYVELVINYEYTAQEDATIAQMAAPQPVLDIHMQTAVNHVQSQHPTSHKGAEAVIKGFIKREGKKALLKHVIPFVAKKAIAFATV